MELTAVLVSLGAEAVATLFLAASLAGLRRWYPSRVLVLWAVGWLAASLASLASLVSLLSVTGASSFPRPVATGTFIVALLVQGALQVEGARLTASGASGASVTRGMGAVMVGAVLYAVFAVALTPDAWTSAARVYFRLVVPYSAAGVCFVVSGVMVARVASAGGLGIRMLPGALVLYGLQLLLTGLVAGSLVTLPTSAVLFTHLLVLLVIAFAIPLWFLEEERSALKAAQARERAVQQRLIQVQRLEALGQLAAGVAHDFNNLLTVVGVHAELIGAEQGAPQSVRDAAGEIGVAARRGGGLVSHLLTFAQRRSLAPSALDLRAEVDALRSFLDPLIGDHIHFTIQHGNERVPAWLEGEQLERTVMNLVLNARDAVGESGTVALRTRVERLDQPLLSEGVVVAPGAWSVLEVEDDGPGIGEDIIDRIFDPFFTTKVRNRGTGLGLATVYGVVREAGGHIVVHSRPGAGARFVLYLPQTEPPASRS